jgi:hypothetical protein
MTLYIHYNQPMDQQSATVTLGLGTVDDSGFMFRMGIIEKSDRTKIRWVIPGWMTVEEIQKAKIIANRDNLIVLEKKELTNDTPMGRNTMDIGAEWPIEAGGASMATVSYLIF